MRPISEATSRITSKSFSRKYISLSRVLSQWGDVVGKDFADKAQPVKLNYRKSKKGEKAIATLEIATSNAYSTALHYQKGLILERINRIFGDQWISEIKFVPSAIDASPAKIKRPPPILTTEEKKYLSDMLASVGDDEIRKRLENLGSAIITDLKQ